MPSFNKVAGCASYQAYAIDMLLMSQEYWSDLDQIIEAHVPLLFVCTGLPLYQLYSYWAGLPCLPEGHDSSGGCIDLLFYDTCCKVYGRINKGSGMHSQPWVNYSLLVRHLTNAKIYLKQAIVKARSKNGELPFDAVSKTVLDNVHFASSLGVQICLYVLACNGIIPDRYCIECELCQGTETAKKFVKMGLQFGSVNKVFANLAVKCQWL